VRSSGALLPICMAGLIAWLYGPVFRELWEVWETDPSYSHGFLIPIVAGYMIWIKWTPLSRTDRAPSFWGALPVAVSLCLLLVGECLESVVAGTGGLFVKGISFPLILSGLVVLLLGPSFLGLLGIPLSYLLFMVPLPGGIFKMLTMPLQDYTSRVTTSALQLSGVPSFREGNVIVLPSLSLGVVEACSGIRSLITLLALASAAAVLLIPSDRRIAQVFVALSAVPIAILTNAFRVTITGLMCHYWGTACAQGFYHDLAGWSVFVLAMSLLGIEVWLLRKLFG